MKSEKDEKLDVEGYFITKKYSPVYLRGLKLLYSTKITLMKCT